MVRQPSLRDAAIPPLSQPHLPLSSHPHPSLSTLHSLTATPLRLTQSHLTPQLTPVVNSSPPQLTVVMPSVTSTSCRPGSWPNRPHLRGQGSPEPLPWQGRPGGNPLPRPLLSYISSNLLLLRARQRAQGTYSRLLNTLYVMDSVPNLHTYVCMYVCMYGVSVCIHIILYVVMQ